MNATDTTVSEYLKQIGVVYRAIYIGEREQDKWQHDSWVVSLTRKDRPTQDFPFRTGLGLRKNNYPDVPEAASALYSLMMDAGAESFEEFCGNYGYDLDSRQAHSIYLACQETAEKLGQIFKADELEHLAKLLQDY